MRLHLAFRTVTALCLGLALVASNLAFAVPCASPERAEAGATDHTAMDHSAHGSHSSNRDEPGTRLPDDSTPPGSHSCSLMVICGGALMADATERERANVHHARATGVPGSPIVAAATQPEPPPPRA